MLQKQYLFYNTAYCKVIAEAIKAHVVFADCMQEVDGENDLYHWAACYAVPAVSLATVTNGVW